MITEPKYCHTNKVVKIVGLILINNETPVLHCTKTWLSWTPNTFNQMTLHNVIAHSVCYFLFIFTWLQSSENHFKTTVGSFRCEFGIHLAKEISNFSIFQNELRSIEAQYLYFFNNQKRRLFRNGVKNEFNSCVNYTLWLCVMS